MERLKKKKGNFEFDISDFQFRVAEEIRKEPGTSFESLEQFLMKWWCRHYNRPYKDVALLEYTTEELLYEFFDIQLRNDPKRLKEILHEGSETNTEDEEWLKDMMGSSYASKEEQEEALDGIRDEIESVGESGSEGFAHEFDLEEFK